MIVGSSGVGSLPGIGSSYTVQSKSYSLDLLIQERDLEAGLSQGLILKKANNTMMDLGALFASTRETPLDLGLMARKVIDLGFPLSVPLQATIEAGTTYDILVQRCMVQRGIFDMTLKRHRWHPFWVECGIMKYDIPARMAFTMRIVDRPTIHRPKRHLVFTVASQERL